MRFVRQIFLRAIIFLLAFLSFACLLGQFYGFWSMRTFACRAYLPAVAVLVFIAWRKRGDLVGLWIFHGTIAGLVAAVAYDAFRLPFVLQGAPLFKPFSHFGELLLGSAEPQWLVQVLGWAYHFSNGAALGIMFVTLAGGLSRMALFWGAIAWALFVETMLLLTPYTTFFGLPLNQRFIVLTLSAHLIFGLTLGLWLRSRAAIIATETCGNSGLRPRDQNG